MLEVFWARGLVKAAKLNIREKKPKNSVLMIG
jgi:hypothetical protein